MAEIITAEHQAEFKRLKEWVIKCPIEAAMRIGELERSLNMEMSNNMIERERIVNSNNDLHFKKDTLIQSLKDIHIAAEVVKHQMSHPQVHRLAITISNMAQKSLEVFE